MNLGELHDKVMELLRIGVDPKTPVLRPGHPDSGAHAYEVEDLEVVGHYEDNIDTWAGKYVVQDKPNILEEGVLIK